MDALPDEVLRRVTERMLDVLEGRDESETFDHLSAKTRKEILEILLETKPQFASARSL